MAFLLSAAVVVAAGTVLARSGDVIAARTRLGGVWIGAVLVAAATSLPVLVTDVSAVRLGALDLAAGDLFGSGMANMLILAVITLLPSGSELFQRAALDHALYAALAILLTCIAAVLVIVRPATAFFGVGVGAALLLAVYLVGSHAIHRHSMTAREAARTAETLGTRPTADTELSRSDTEHLPPLRGAVLRFAVASLVIIASAPIFAHAAAQLAVVTGLGNTFFGTWLVGLSTSLPELVTSMAAVRIGAYDLAVGNLFGSNALNMSVFVALDLAHGGPVLSAVSGAHVLSALITVALMCTGLSALVFRAKRRLTMLEPSGATMAIIYVVGLALLYLETAG
jgi:cation:H+ antiporter